MPGNGRKAGAAGGPEPPGTGQPFDGALALMHLIEPVMIDFQCAITDQKRCSGITAAHRGVPGRYDLIVESPDCGIARCCLALALSSVSAATDGSFPGAVERDILQVARAGRALGALRDVGYLISVLSDFRVSSC